MCELAAEAPVGLKPVTDVSVVGVFFCVPWGGRKKDLSCPSRRALPPPPLLQGSPSPRCGASCRPSPSSWTGSRPVTPSCSPSWTAWRPSPRPACRAGPCQGVCFLPQNPASDRTQGFVHLREILGTMKLTKLTKYHGQLERPLHHSQF